MRAVTPDEAEAVIRRCNWATICTVDERGFPYAVEATPFYMDGRHCFMINPRGGTWKNTLRNSNVLLKYTLTNADLSFWAGVSCLGGGEFVIDAAAVREGWRLLGNVISTDYSRAADTFAGLKDRSPLFCVQVSSVTGRCNAAKNGELDWSALDGGNGKISGEAV